MSIDDDVYQAAMERAHATGERLGKALSELARAGLQPAKAFPVSKRKGFACIEIPPDAPRLDPQRIQKAWDDEAVF